MTRHGADLRQPSICPVYINSVVIISKDLVNSKSSKNSMSKNPEVLRKMYDVVIIGTGTLR